MVLFTRHDVRALPLRRSTRDAVEGDLAAGVLWVTLLFAAVLGINRLFVAEREEGGFDGFLLAPVDRTALFVAKAVVLFALPRRASSSSPCRRSRVLLLGPSPRPGAAGAGRSCCVLADVGIAVVGTLVGALAVQTRARDLIVPLLALPLLIPVVIARGAGDRAAARSTAGAERAAEGAGWWSSGSMIWSSGCSPTRSSTSCWRTDACMFGRGLKPLSIALRRRSSTARFALVVLLRAQRRRPGLHAEDLLPARAAGDRRAVRLRGRRRSTAIRYLRTRRPRATTCAPTSRSTCR